MAITYWHKQNLDTPLFPDLIWSRPEQSTARGKLLIIGGNQYGFAAPADAYSVAIIAGVGTARVLLPKVIKKVAGSMLETVAFAPNTPSGSFAKSALAELLDQALWADGILLAGDLGHNSETATLLDEFLEKYQGRVTLANDAIGYSLGSPIHVLNRPETLLVVTMAQLQKLAINAHFESSFRYGMDLIHLVESLHIFTAKYLTKIIVKHQNQLIVACNGQISTTQTPDDVQTWRTKTATQATIWWLQNPAKPFEALTTSAI